jgi:flagellar basal-body rod protein FlgB
LINNDLTTATVEMALDGLARRSEMIANNIANAEVPNYRAQRISFENVLRAAIADGRLSDYAGPASAPSGGTPGINGNTVQMEEELVALVKTNLAQEAMVHAFNYKTGLWRTAMRGQ